MIRRSPYLRKARQIADQYQAESLDKESEYSVASQSPILANAARGKALPHKPIPVDVRIISASNKDLEDLIAQDLFREDLFFRINVFPLQCPSLSERLDDIHLIVQNFIEQNAAKSSKKIIGLTPEAMEALFTYSWPGNVRELRNAIEYAFVLCPGNWIGVEHLPPKITGAGKRNSYLAA